MIRQYDELTDEEQNKLSKAWVQITQGLDVYAEVTGAGSLDDMVNERIWEEIELQKQEEEEVQGE